MPETREAIVRALAEECGSAFVCPYCGAGKARMGLTPVQLTAYEAICAHIDLHGYSPSYDELMRAIGINSKSGIHRIVCALTERGYVNFIPAKPRSISIVGRAA